MPQEAGLTHVFHKLGVEHLDMLAYVAERSHEAAREAAQRMMGGEGNLVTPEVVLRGMTERQQRMLQGCDILRALEFSKGKGEGSGKAPAELTPEQRLAVAMPWRTSGKGKKGEGGPAESEQRLAGCLDGSVDPRLAYSDHQSEQMVARGLTLWIQIAAMIRALEPKAGERNAWNVVRYGAAMGTGFVRHTNSKIKVRETLCAAVEWYRSIPASIFAGDYSRLVYKAELNLAEYDRIYAETNDEKNAGQTFSQALYEADDPEKVGAVEALRLWREFLAEKAATCGCVF